MKIEVGKFYKTRNGGKARIYAIGEDNAPGQEIQGAYLSSTGWATVGWYSGGTYLPPDWADRSDLDIVSPWEEETEAPRPFRLGDMVRCKEKECNVCQEGGNEVTYIDKSNSYLYTSKCGPLPMENTLLVGAKIEPSYAITYTYQPPEVSASGEEQKAECRCSFTGFGHDSGCAYMQGRK